MTGFSEKITVCGSVALMLLTAASLQTPLFQTRKLYLYASSGCPLAIIQRRNRCSGMHPRSMILLYSVQAFITNPPRAM